MLLYLKNQLKLYSILFYCIFFFSNAASCQPQNYELKVIIIRHGEKPKNGDNLNCQGLNRAGLLPDVIISKFGVPAYSYVPSLSADSVTKHARMFQTLTPLAVKYNLAINSKFNGKDSSGIVQDILKKQGNVLVVWDHRSIVPIIHAFGINGTQLKWDDDDFDSIWIITFKNGVAVLTKDKEGLTPAADCR
jgi:hypothetical protein